MIHFAQLEYLFLLLLIPLFFILNLLYRRAQRKKVERIGSGACGAPYASPLKGKELGKAGLLFACVVLSGSCSCKTSDRGAS